MRCAAVPTAGGGHAPAYQRQRGWGAPSHRGTLSTHTGYSVYSQRYFEYSLLHLRIDGSVYRAERSEQRRVHEARHDAAQRRTTTAVGTATHGVLFSQTWVDFSGARRHRRHAAHSRWLQLSHVCIAHISTATRSSAACRSCTHSAASFAVRSSFWCLPAQRSAPPTATRADGVRASAAAAASLLR